MFEFITVLVNFFVDKHSLAETVRKVCYILSKRTSRDKKKKKRQKTRCESIGYRSKTMFLSVFFFFFLNRQRGLSNFLSLQKMTMARVILTLLVFVFCRRRFACRNRATVSTVLRWASVVLGVRPACSAFDTFRCSQKTGKKKQTNKHYNIVDLRGRWRIAWLDSILDNGNVSFHTSNNIIVGTETNETRESCLRQRSVINFFFFHWANSLEQDIRGIFGKKISGLGWKSEEFRHPQILEAKWMYVFTVRGY